MVKPVIVSVRISEDDLRKLQLIARVCGQPAGELIRAAVGEKIRSMAEDKDLMAKVSEMLKQDEAMLNQFLVAAGL